MSEFFKELILPLLVGLVAIALFVLLIAGLVWVSTVTNPLVLATIFLVFITFHLGTMIIQEFQ